MALGAYLIEFLSKIGHAAAAKPKFNLVYLIFDDMKPIMVPYSQPGEPLFGKTRGFEKLFKRSNVYDQETAQPVCNSARISKILGQHPIINDFNHNVYQQSNKTLASVLIANGYYVGSSGKYGHENPDIKIRAMQLMQNMGDFSEQARALAAGNSVCGGKIACPKPTRQVADFAVEQSFMNFLQRMTQRTVQDKPFAYLFGYHLPHLTMDVATPFWGKTRGDMPNPVTPKIDVAPGDKRIGDKQCDEMPYKINGAKLIDGKARKSSSDIIKFPRIVKSVRAAYTDAILNNDQRISDLLKALDSSPFANNTVVVVTADHGFGLADEVNLWCKGFLYDSATKTPFYISVPGVKGGVYNRNTLVSSIDEFPTILASLGLKLIPGLQGVSIVPTFSNTNALPNRMVFSKYPACQPKTQIQVEPCASDPHGTCSRPAITMMGYKVKHRADDNGTECQFMGWYDYDEKFIGCQFPNWPNKPPALANYGIKSKQVDLKASHTVWNTGPYQPTLFCYNIYSNDNKYRTNMAVKPYTQEAADKIEFYSRAIQRNYERLGM